MTLTLELPPDVEARLEVEAKKQGLTLSEYALQKLIDLQKPVEELTSGESVLHLMEQFRASIPEEEWNKLPPYYAVNYKHYLHSYPRAEE